MLPFAAPYYALAKAALLTGTSVQAWVAMSNHVHMVLTGVHGLQPEFMEILDREIAKDGSALSAAESRAHEPFRGSNVGSRRDHDPVSLFEASFGRIVTRKVVVTDPRKLLRLQGLSVGIGGFVTNDLALTLRWALSGGFEDVTIREPDGDLEKATLAFGPQFLGPTAQLWLNDSLFVSAGVGLGIYGVHPLLDLIDRNSDLDISVDTRYGIGASLRSAFTVWQRENAALIFIGAEALPIFLDDDVVVGGGLVAGFQVL